MVSLINTHTRIPNFCHPFSRLICPLIPYPIYCVYNPKRRAKRFKKFDISFGFAEPRRGINLDRILDNSWCCRCKPSEGDIELEAEIMDFMVKSEKPTMFPTKKELIEAGRTDLVESIKMRGGWYSLGWVDETREDNVEEAVDLDIVEFQRRVESCRESTSLRGHYDDDDSSFGHEKEDAVSSQVHCNNENLRLDASASLSRSLDRGASEDTGIEGILSRLDRERNRDLGISLGKNGYAAHSKSEDAGDEHVDPSLGVARTYLGENRRVAPDSRNKGMLSTSSLNISPNIEPCNWRTWSNQRPGLQYTEFEAAEISFSKNQVESDEESSRQTVITEEYVEAWDRQKETDHNEIRTRLQHLEAELTTALHSLRSKREEIISEEVTGSSMDLQKLSDAWEFQENEFISVQERLRSIRAKLAVLEGKMALAINDSQKIVEDKQKQIDGARKALQLLRTTYIVWPNPASEVRLAGSFDGWTSQRKMDKSKTGLFSVRLKLYPGRYEFKFIVDGIWKIDPLRPIVNNNGHENNLFIVT